MFCLECGLEKSANSFGDEMLVHQSGFLQCSLCVEHGAVKPTWVSRERPCVSCGQLKGIGMFSHKQLKNSSGSKCVHCMGQATCSRCMQQVPIERFSNTQLSKGFRLRRCKDCCTPPPSAKAYKNKKRQAS